MPGAGRKGYRLSTRRSWVRQAVRLSIALACLTLSAEGVLAQSRGEELYLQHCAACHQPNGKGILGIFPPLAGNADVIAEDPQEVQVYLGRIIFGYHGALIVNRELYTGRMPPIGYFGRLNDSELLDLINYIRGAWGNSARPVTFAELATARAADRPEPGGR